MPRGYCLEASMTAARPVIADQVRNDGIPFPALWIPAYAGMTGQGPSYWLQGSIHRAGQGGQQFKTPKKLSQLLCIYRVFWYIYHVEYRYMHKDGF